MYRAPTGSRSQLEAGGTKGQATEGTIHSATLQDKCSGCCPESAILRPTGNEPQADLSRESG